MPSGKVWLGSWLGVARETLQCSKRSKAMATDMQAVSVAQVQRASGVPWQRIRQVAAPLLYGAMVASAGTLAGAIAGSLSAPESVASAAHRVADRASAGSPVNCQAAVVLAAFDLRGNALAAAALNRAPAYTPSPFPEDWPAPPSASSLAQHRAVKAGRSSAAPHAVQKAPSVEKDAVRPAVPAERRRARPAHPLTRSPRTFLASLSKGASRRG